MSEAVMNAIGAVVEYLHDDEERHYLESGDNGETTDHVFQHVQVLREFLDTDG